MKCKYMIFIYLIASFITWMVYLDPTHWPAPCWLVSSVSRALHRYRKGHGFKSRTGLNFFQVLFLTTRFSSVLSCEDVLISSLHRSANIWISYIYNHHSLLGWFIWTQHIDKLPVGLLAQLVERCTGIAEVMGSNPVRAWIFFFQVLFSTTRLSSILCCEDLLISSLHRSANVWISYI